VRGWHFGFRSADYFLGCGSVAPLNKLLEATQDDVTVVVVPSLLWSHFYFFRRYFVGRRWTRLRGVEVAPMAPKEISDGFVMYVYLLVNAAMRSIIRGYVA
jgi:hypothetical protein